MKISARHLGVLVCALILAGIPVEAVAASGAKERGTASAASRAIIREVNAVRAANGLAPVRVSSTLTRDARRYAGVVMRGGQLTHASDQTGTGFAWGGEVLAFVRKSSPAPAQTVRAWVASPAHHAVLMNPKYTHVGMGLRRGRFGSGPAWVWVGRFGAR